MAEKDKPEEGAAPAAKSGGVLPWVIVGTVAAGIGAVVPFGMSMMAGHPEEKPKTAQPYETTPRSSAMKFLPYREVTVNLDEARMNRYLRLKIVLHIRESDEHAVSSAIAKKDLILRNWMVSHLSDKELDDIRGKAGQNMLRREIRDYFNATLFDDNYDRIYDVLFDEFNVQ
ncbi:flagellar basal body-associated FliL family protein [Planctomicrobium sp. SH661]|uniref:flagellar basal body-associated FliL family protein n=1 Tax=Planctomicrobium sp. SH661 TaxID=3448124 RepID=UPI003F5B6D4F